MVGHVHGHLCLLTLLKDPFLVYINDLSKNLSSTAKLLADYTSIFSIVYDISLSSLQLNDYLIKISNCTYQRKMSFNAEVTKQAQEVVLSRKSQKVTHPTVYFNNSPMIRSSSQKHSGIHLDEKLNFINHIKEKISKANKGVGFIKNLNNTLPRKALLTLYKSFIIPHLDYGDIIYDQPNNESFCNKLETVQYNAALAITRSIQGTSKVKLNKELGL